MAPFGGSAKPLQKVSHDMGYRSNSIAISRDVGPLSQLLVDVHPRKDPGRKETHADALALQCQGISCAHSVKSAQRLRLERSEFATLEVREGLRRKRGALAYINLHFLREAQNGALPHHCCSEIVFQSSPV